jgi:CubicO group peptidase (beta-lactamase class C family)
MRLRSFTVRLKPDTTYISITTGTLALLLSVTAGAQQLTPTEREQVDRDTLALLQATGAPSASIAIVRGNEIAYERAYGDGRVEPRTPASPSMRYAIGSVSKQFTAAALLLLEQDGQLSLNDKVARWFPQLTRANEISVRQLLSMTSGYQDYWPQDYVFPDMRKPAAAQAIMQRWAAKPLDFEPGTKWQYSNTNYVIAAAIVERVSGMPFMQFLRTRIFAPLKMTSVADFDAGPLSPADAGAYLRNGLGPLRPAPKEASGWLFGAGQLAMTAHDLALWNLSVIKGTILRPESYRSQQADVLLQAGNATGYGLGVTVSVQGGRRRISHGGAVSGYTTSNHIFPDNGAAIVVFTNVYPGAVDAPGRIAQRIASVILQEKETPGDALELARRIYDGLAKGTIDRALLTPAASDYFNQEVLADYAASLGKLSRPSDFEAAGDSVRGGLLIRSYRIRADKVQMRLTVMTQPDGRIDQYIIERTQ